jgi:hypothetical protein
LDSSWFSDIFCFKQPADFLILDFSGRLSHLGAAGLMPQRLKPIYKPAFLASVCNPLDQQSI